jgi:hypothetical protein
MASCEVCGKAFTKKAGLAVHLKRKVPCVVPVAPGVPLTEFRESSKTFHKSLTKEVRQNEGIFFTPKKVRDRLFECLQGFEPKRILEPSFGSGEFLLDAKRIWPQAAVVGVEKNKALFDSVVCPGAELVCQDFLEWSSRVKSDLILGNPPYFTMKDVPAKYKDLVNGRPNIYVLFLWACLTEHLAADGIIAFVLPSSLYNCSYYQKLRDYIQANTTILHLETLLKPGFYETNQDTMLLVLQNGKTGDDYIYRGNGRIYINPYFKELGVLTKDTTTLSALGLGVKTGNVVWNQVKENLVEEGGTLLIYSSNLKGSVLELGNLRGDEKKQYVTGLTKPTLDGPVILVERGYGNTFHFNCVLTDRKGFYAENHINVVYAKVPAAIGNLARALKSFQDPRSKQFLELFLGNGSVTATDMELLLPVF